MIIKDTLNQCTRKDHLSWETTLELWISVDIFQVTPSGRRRRVQYTRKQSRKAAAVKTLEAEQRQQHSGSEDEDASSEVAEDDDAQRAADDAPQAADDAQQAAENAAAPQVADGAQPQHVMVRLVFNNLFFY